MEKVTLDELYAFAEEKRDILFDQAAQYDRDPKIYLHWTAGHYGQFFEGHKDYHVMIDGNGDIYYKWPFDTTTDGTWRRNTGAVNIALCCGVGAGSRDLGSEPPTEKQIEVLAQVIWKIADALWLTIDKKHVLTHGEAANNEDGYFDAHMPYSWWNDSYGDGDTRGDLEYLGTEESPSYNPHATDGTRGGDVLRGKANWYRENS